MFNVKRYIKIKRHRVKQGMSAHYPRPLAALVPGLTKDIFGSKNMLFGKMAANWAAIAGEDMAQKTMPLDLKFNRTRPPKEKPGKAVDKNIRGIPSVASLAQTAHQAVLHLAVQPAFALEFSYQKPLLIERLNMFFGYPAIKDIRIIQHGEIEGNKVTKTPVTRPVTVQEERQIAEAVAGIQENDLQIALKNLGKAIISRTKQEG
jgi:hypothetical protein